MGYSSIQQYATIHRWDSFNFYQNTFSPKDMADLLANLYQGKLLDRTLRDQLLGYMQNTNEEEFIPAAVPSGWVVYHKTGTLDDNIHDGVIITNGKL